MIPVEIVIAADSQENIAKWTRAAIEGGASRIELCAEMAHDGLTPSDQAIMAAREALGALPGLMVMVRPVFAGASGSFSYDKPMINLMCRQIEQAAAYGANGVVLAALQRRQANIHLGALRQLVRTAKRNRLSITFHRAFDAMSDSRSAIEILVDIGVDRILTAGSAWGGKNSALDSVQTLSQTIRQAADRLEVVVCGGITAEMAPCLLAQLPGHSRISLHAFSGVLSLAHTDARRVRALVDATNS